MDAHALKNVMGCFINHPKILSAALPVMKKNALISARIPKIIRNFDKKPWDLNPATINKNPKNIAIANKYFLRTLVLFFCNFARKISGLIKNSMPAISQNQPKILANISPHLSFYINKKG